MVQSLLGRYLLTAGLFSRLAMAAVGEKADSIFPVPEILVPNVNFWTRIYTEISYNEGIFHDREYPECVYAKIVFPTQYGPSERSRLLEERRNAIAKSIQRIASEPESSLCADEREIFEIMKRSMPPEQVATAAERIRFQQGQKERFLEGLQRSGAYLDTIRAVFSNYGIPARVAYLPHVESSFNIKAYSKVGAAGMWQFMRSTGRLFLSIDYLVDERWDPFLSTIAAAKLLKKNYDELGSWPLAITAYNHGLGGMKAAVAKTGSRDIAVVIQKHTSPSFKFASKNFYACFLAASAIAENPEPFFGPVAMDPRLIVNEVVLPYPLSPAILSKYLGVSQELLQKLNPALRPIVFRHQRAIPRGYRLRIPSQMDSLSAVALLSRAPDSLKRAEPAPVQYYEVERGDNLSSIAARFNVPVRMLAEENDLDRSLRIYVGQVLRIPTRATEVTVGGGAAAPFPVAAAEETLSALAEAETPVWVETLPPAARPTIGDTLAAQPASTPARPSAPPVGPASATPPKRVAHVAPDSAAAEIAVSSALPLSSTFDVSIYHLDLALAPTGDNAEIRVSVDETISHYAEWLGVTAQQIRTLNRLGPRSAIHINQRLLIPLGRGRLDRFVAARLEYHMALEEDFYRQYKVVGTQPLIVGRGQTLWDICNGDEPIPLWLLMKHNRHIELTTLTPGMRIEIPIIAERSDDDTSDAAVPPAVPPPPAERPYRPPLRATSLPLKPVP